MERHGCGTTIRLSVSDKLALLIWFPFLQFQKALPDYVLQAASF